MTTVDEMVQLTKQKLRGFTGRDRLTFLFAGITSSATSLVVASLDNALKAGSIISIGYERMYVLGVAGNTLTVLRGYESSLPAAHLAADIVEIEPRWPSDIVAAEIADEIRSWPSGLFAVSTAEVTFGSGVGSAELDVPAGVDVHRIVDASVLHSGDPRRIGRLDLRLIRNADTTVFPSGVAVALPSHWAYGDTQVARVTYAHSFDTASITTTTDLENDVGLARSMLDIIPYGVGVKMMAGKDALRNDLGAQGQQRISSEVPPLSWAKGSQLWQQIRESRLSQEQTRLLDLYPWRNP